MTQTNQHVILRKMRLLIISDLSKQSFSPIISVAYLRSRCCMSINKRCILVCNTSFCLVVPSIASPAIYSFVLPSDQFLWQIQQTWLLVVQEHLPSTLSLLFAVIYYRLIVMLRSRGGKTAVMTPKKMYVHGML
jgi:hypothetical protein